MERGMQKLKYGKGKSSIEIDGLQKEIFLATIRAADPVIIKVLEETTAKLKKQSEEAWLIRLPKYGESQGSKNKHRTGLRIIPPYTVEAFVENYAPYAWAIRVGRQSKSNLREGKRLAQAVLWSPAKKNAQKVVEEIAKQTIKRIKKL
jgi:hypothetical protein